MKRRNHTPSPKIPKKQLSPRKREAVFVLFVGDEGAILSYMEHKSVVRRLFSAAPGEKTSETFRELLGQYPDTPIYILVDLVDQSYVRHTLPPVSFLGVQKIIQRRLARDFAAEDLKGAIPLGREKGGRKDWNFLLVSLSSTGPIREWCNMLYELPNRFMGVYLAPVECELLLPVITDAFAATSDPNQKTQNEAQGRSSYQKRLRVALPKKQKNKATQTLNHHWDILVVHNKTGGFRQVVLKNKKLVFTRMAQSHIEEKATVQAGHVEQEVKNTIEYLKRLSFNDNATLAITIIAGDDLRPHISDQAFQATSTSIYTPYDVAERTGLTQCILSGDKFCDILLGSLFVNTKKHKLRLLPDYVKKIEYLYNALSYTRIGAMLAGILLMLGIFYDVYNGINNHAALNDARTKSKDMSARLQSFRDEGKQFAEDPLKVNTLIKIKDMISIPFPHYQDLTTILRPIIEDSITISELEWSLFGLEVDILDSAQTTTPQTQEQGSRYAIDATLTMELTPPAGEQERLLLHWEELFTTLQQQKMYLFEHNTDVTKKAEKDEVNINFEDQSSLENEALQVDDKVDIHIKVRSNPANQSTPIQPTPNALLPNASMSQEGMYE